MTDPATANEPARELATRDAATVATEPTSAPALAFSQEQRDLIRRTIAAGTSDDEFALFMQIAVTRGLNPLAKQVHAVMRRTKDNGQWVNKMVVQTGIDGYRLIAERTGRYEGQTPVEWCGDDGVWTDVWLSTEPPRAARVGIYKAGFRAPLVRVAHYDEYVQTYTKNGQVHVNAMWTQRGPAQLAKCAEALGLRTSFPEELSGLYTHEEMGQADPPAHVAAMDELEDVLADGIGDGYITEAYADQLRDHARAHPAAPQQSIDRVAEMHGRWQRWKASQDNADDAGSATVDVTPALPSASASEADGAAGDDMVTFGTGDYAALSNCGVDDVTRHDLVAIATGGRTRSSKDPMTEAERDTVKALAAGWHFELFTLGSATDGFPTLEVDGEPVPVDTVKVAVGDVDVALAAIRNSRAASDGDEAAQAALPVDGGDS